MLSRFRFSYFFLIYFGLRIFSFYFQPTTPLNQSPHLLNTFLSFLILSATAVLIYKKNFLGWYIVAGEMILGGSGAFLEFFGITLRTLLLVTSLAIYFWQEKSNLIKIGRNNLLIGSLLLVAAIGLVRGLLFNHAKALIISDAIPYLFLLYYFPLRRLLTNESWKKWCFSALKVTIICQAIFILFTLMGFSSGQFQLQDAFYHWYRDVAIGKITPIEFDYYRLVLNEQLLLVPALLFFLYKIINNKQGYLSATLLLFLLSTNLTRIYLIALSIGILTLFNRKNWKRAMAVSISSFLVFIVIFSSLFMIASQGKSFGFEVFGLRMQSIVIPTMEESSFSRMLLLPKIFNQITEHPVFGSGLGSKVSVFSPVENRIISTPNYDWGYLELIVELGIIGFIVWIFFIYNIAIKKNNLPRWQIASLVSLLIINITSPAIFHVFGLSLLALLIALKSNVFAELPAAQPHTS